MSHMYVQLLILVTSLFVGVSLQVVARHLRIPAVAPLLLGGVILGPEVLNIITPETLGAGLNLIVSLAVAVILFEGGLTLEAKGFQKAPRVIWQLLTIGVLTTWIGTALVVYFLFDLPVDMALLAGSLVIVTGPTVITPLLQRINIKAKLHHILHWEAVLIDPIGVFIAILCFELLSVDDTFLPIGQFGLRVLVGMGLGILGGFGTHAMLEKKWIQEQYTNIFVLSMALLLFGLSDLMVKESGLLTVVVMGFILGMKKPVSLQNIQKFKLELTEMAIGLVFILLAARLRVEDFKTLGWEGALALALVILVIRPLVITLCSYKTDLDLREKLFLSWMAPRGIVAGSMASLFALQLASNGYPNATFLEVFTFSIIGLTVLFQGLSAGIVATALDLRVTEKNGWLIIGANFFARRVARFITKTTKTNCLLIDLNADAINEARAEGITALQANALEDDVIPAEMLISIGNVLALTDNRRMNNLICQKWSSVVGEEHVFQWSPEVASDAKQAGTAIWQQIPRPSQVAYDLKHTESILVRADAQRFSSKDTKDTTALIVAEEGGISFQDSITPQTEGEVLLLRQHPQQIPFFIHPHHVALSEAERLDDLLATLLGLVEGDYPDFPKDEILAALLERENNFPTLLSNGVAVPHTYTDAIKEPLCMVLQHPNGIQWHQQSEDQAHLIFLLLTPVNDREIHLMLLAEVAKVASIPEFVDQLVYAPTPEKLIEYLKTNFPEDVDIPRQNQSITE